MRVAADLLDARNDHTVTVLCTAKDWSGRPCMSCAVRNAAKQFDIRTRNQRSEPEPGPEPEIGSVPVPESSPAPDFEAGAGLMQCVFCAR